ncbi:MAG: enoyl-CoA hydratase/isomerase family protein [Pacificimonas sp.]|jgi:methylglutaconyl-CoA hydratase|nr:enoyl-CoA hydratase/isomerase family protein [Pacificimonas sp.]
MTASLPTSTVLDTDIDERNVAILTLNRPGAGNALDADLIASLTDAFRSIAGIDAVRAVILTAKGPNFSVGDDARRIAARLSWSAEETAADKKTMTDLIDAIRRCPVPVIAAVRGRTNGSAVALLLAADLAVADRGATFSFPDVRYGAVPGLFADLLAEEIGRSAARALLLTGGAIPAVSAAQLDLVQQVTGTPQNMDDVVSGWIRQIERAAPSALAGTKAMLAPGGDPQQAFLDSWRSADAKRGIRAMLEGREPNWNAADA